MTVLHGLTRLAQLVVKDGVDGEASWHSIIQH